MEKLIQIIPVMTPIFSVLSIGFDTLRVNNIENFFLFLWIMLCVDYVFAMRKYIAKTTMYRKKLKKSNCGQLYLRDRDPHI